MGGVRWAVAIAFWTYLAQALALVALLVAHQSGAKPIPTGELASAARWVSFYTGMAAMFLGGLALGRFKPFDEALNLGLLSAGLFLAMDVTLAATLVPKLQTWDWAAYSFLSKAIAAALGAWMMGSATRRR